MPTNDERREAATRLRELYPSNVLPPSSQIRIDICNIIGCGFGQEHQGEKIHNRLADLIEPEPERTCRIDRRVPDAPFCSECAYDWNDDWNLCPKCGAKVVSE